MGDSFVQAKTDVLSVAVSVSSYTRTPSYYIFLKHSPQKLHDMIYNARPWF